MRDTYFRSFLGNGTGTQTNAITNLLELFGDQADIVTTISIFAGVNCLSEEVFSRFQQDYCYNADSAGGRRREARRKEDIWRTASVSA